MVLSFYERLVIHLDSINQRVKCVRNALSMNQTEFGAKLAVSQNYLSNIEKGYRDVTEKILKLICLEFNVNENYLRNGTDPMFNQSETFSLDEYAREHNASDIDIEILKIYLNLDKDVRKKIISDFKKIFVENKSTYMDNEPPHVKEEIQAEKEKNINIFEQKPKQKPKTIKVPARGGYYEIEETEESIEALKRDNEKDFEYNPDYF